MTPQEKLQKIKVLINPPKSNCQCGHFESCDFCNSYSAYNQLIIKIDEVLSGPKPSPDYGASFVIKREDLED